MSKLKLLGLLFFSSVLQLNAQLTTDEWEEDLTYLRGKIDKEFVSFIPGIKKDFMNELEGVVSSLPELEDHEVACEIMRILSTLKDGHTELNVGNSTVGFHRLPMSLYFFEGDLYVVAAHESYQHLVGGKVINIGKYDVEQAFARLKANMSRDNDMEYLHAGPGYLILTELLAYLEITEDPSETTFTVLNAQGEIMEEQIKGIDLNTYNEGPWINVHQLRDIKRPLYLSQYNWYWHEYLDTSKTMYFNFTRVNNKRKDTSIKKYIKQLFKEIDEKQPERLIIDFRRNNGGNYHLSRPLVEAIKSRDWLNQPGKLYVINGRRTFSAASVATIYLKTETESIILGEPGRTHPNWSDNNEYMTLPNSGFLIEYTTRIKKHWPEEPSDRIPVDIEIPPTWGAYSKGEDPVLAYILGMNN